MASRGLVSPRTTWQLGRSNPSRRRNGHRFAVRVERGGKRGAGPRPWPRDIEAGSGGGEGEGTELRPWPTPEQTGQRQSAGGKPPSPLSSSSPRLVTFLAAAEPPRGCLGAEAAALEARTPTNPATRALALTSAPRSPHDASLRAAGGLFGDAGPSFVRPSRYFQPPHRVRRMDASFLSHKISVYRTSIIRDLTDAKSGWSWLWFRGVVPEPFVSVLR